jgi:hypothetical protein
MQGHEILNASLLPLRTFLAKNSINEKNIEWIKKYLENVTLLTGLTYKQKISTFQRITVNPKIFAGQNKRITEIKYLTNPPKELVNTFGRANSPGESILYATFDPITALSEMRPNIGDLITISKWRLKTEYDLTVTPVFKNSTKNGEVHNEMSFRANIEYRKQLKQYDEQLQKQLDIILQFVADCFNKDVNDGNHFDYFLSSHYANRLLWELQNGEIDAILYPSVRQSLTLTNIALKPLVFKTNYELELVEESVVTQNLSKASRGWLMEGTGYSKIFDDKNIIW